MPNYNKIKKEELRKLIILSESIRSLPEDKAQEMIDRIAELSPEEEKSIIEVLKDEQNVIKEAKTSKGLTPEREIQALEEDMTKVKRTTHNYEAAVLKINERHERDESSEAAERLLDDL